MTDGKSLSELLGCNTKSTKVPHTSLSEKTCVRTLSVETKAFGDNEIYARIYRIDYYDDRNVDSSTIVGTEYRLEVSIWDNSTPKFEGDELPTAEYLGNEFTHAFSDDKTYEDALKRLGRWAKGHNGKVYLVEGA